MSPAKGAPATLSDQPFLPRPIACSLDPRTPRTDVDHPARRALTKGAAEPAVLDETMLASDPRRGQEAPNAEMPAMRHEQRLVQ
jgi:hypothetical protein